MLCMFSFILELLKSVNKTLKEFQSNYSKIRIHCNTVFVNEADACLPLLLSLSSFINLTCK